MYVSNKARGEMVLFFTKRKGMEGEARTRLIVSNCLNLDFNNYNQVINDLDYKKPTLLESKSNTIKLTVKW